MLNLLRSEWLKAKKDLSIKIALVVIVFFAIMNVVTLLIMGKFMQGNSDLGEYSNLMNATAKQAFINSFSLTNNVGILIPVILCLFVGKEFAYGTIRNKIISGAKRSSVYLSSFISASLVGLFLLTVYVLLNLLIGLPILKFGPAFNSSELLILLKVYGLGCLIFLSTYAITVFILMLTRNQAISIILSIVILLILALIVMGLSGLNPVLDKFINVTPFYQSQALVSGKLTNKFVLEVIISSIVGISFFNILGVVIFNKLDLK